MIWHFVLVLRFKFNLEKKGKDKTKENRLSTVHNKRNAVKKVRKDGSIDVK
jgi:hypothetical protein